MVLPPRRDGLDGIFAVVAVAAVVALSVFASARHRVGRRVVQIRPASNAQSADESLQQPTR
jgi:hypothetical protein